MGGFAQDVSPRCPGRLSMPLKAVPPVFVQQTSGAFRWTVASEVRDLLLGPAGLRLDEWLRSGQARIIKKGPHRVVYRIELPQLTFFVKKNLVPDWTTWLRQLVRPSKARTEFERALAVAQRGLPTFLPLALGEEQGFLGVGGSILVTRSLEETQPLQVFLATTLAALPEPRRARLRHQAAVGLAHFVARLHDAGILHNDFHPANILVHLDPEDHLSFFLIDLNAVQLRAPLAWAQSRHNLVVLNRWFVLRANRSDRLRFWQAYRAARRLGQGCQNLNSEQYVWLADELEKDTWQSNLRFWKRRDRRSLRDNRYYRCLRSRAVVGYAVTDLDAAALALLQEDPDEPFRRPGIKLLKNSPSSTVAEFSLVVNGQARQVIYKRFRVTTWADPLAALARPTPALRSWIFGQGFRERGLPTARPLAVLHRRRIGLWQEGYLLAEKIENAQELRDFVRDLQRLPASQRRHVLRRQLAQVAQVIRELHRRCLSHRDLKAANVLVSRDVSRFVSPFNSPLGTCSQSLLPIFLTSVWLIDLVGVERHRRLSRSRKIQNLTRLHASFHEHPILTRTDKLRFLREYLHWALHGGGDWKNWWKVIDRATRAKIARNKRRGRPLA
jgi:tRNA A-37 threonylcarbamoyl transferase component Bud32